VTPYLLALFLLAQNFSQRGFIESRLTAYPQETPRDQTHAVGEALLRYEGFYTATNWLQLAGAVDLRTDTHHQVEREFTFSWTDRTRRRPAAALRRLTANYHTGNLTLELGKQFVRWGKTDILTPTDRFAPRDFLTVVDNEFLPVTAARLTYEKGIDTIDVVWAPLFTPSRIPLYDQRWAAVPPGITLRDDGADFPAGSQAGIRWNRAGSVESAVSVYRGFNNLPSFQSSFAFTPSGEALVGLRRFYPQMLMVGGDAALPLPWLTLKGEAGYFSSTDSRADEYVLWVLQLERQSGEWFFVGGYAGEAVTQDGSQPADFAPDRGLSKTFLGRAGYTINANRSIAFEAAARQNGDGIWARFEYSQAFGQHWRATGMATIIRGDPTDFLGQYRNNSHAAVVLRYSF
jgi:hypothetical protein